MPATSFRIVLCFILPLAITALADPPLPAGKGPRLTGPFTQGT